MEPEYLGFLDKPRGALYAPFFFHDLFVLPLEEGNCREIRGKWAEKGVYIRV